MTRPSSTRWNRQRGSQFSKTGVLRTLSAPAQLPRAATCRRLPTSVRPARSHAAPGASAGLVVPRALRAPARVNCGGDAIALASVFATAFGQSASRSASGSGFSQPLTRRAACRSSTFLSALGPALRSHSRSLRPALLGIRACVIWVVCAVTRPWVVDGDALSFAWRLNRLMARRAHEGSGDGSRWVELVWTSRNAHEPRALGCS